MFVFSDVLRFMINKGCNFEHDPQTR